MPFWDRNDARVPEEVRNLTPEQIQTMLAFYNANKDKVPQMEAELGTAKQTLANVETQFTETKNRVAQLEAAVASRPPETTQQNPPGNPPAVDWFEDPRKAFFEQVKPLADFSLAQGAHNAKRDLEDHLRENPGKYGDNYKLYKKYQKEITDLMSREQLANQANPQAWLNAFSLIKGFHDEEISEARKAGDGEFFGETPRGTPAVTPMDQADNITDKDRDLGRKFGVTPEQVRDSRKTLTYDTVEARPKGF